MPATLSIHAILSRPATLQFPSNSPYAVHFDEQGGRVAQLSGGHYVFYGRHGRRLLLTDPDGHPLHECEWGKDQQGRDILIRARVRLDWGAWVGIRPSGLVNATTLDLSRKPGWQSLRADDLRLMAARAMQVPLEEVRFFYGDSDLLIERGGIATIRHRKDALYVLEDGTFGRPRFMSCMGAMHWEDIDFLPVVELFRSLLPGTGPAVFELIRGLYDDQNADRSAPRPLRYRGIPTYPSEAAFKLFSAFFTPQAPPGGGLFSLFMDAPRSQEITWLPAEDYPLRYIGQSGRYCVTVKQHSIERLTLTDDEAGLSYVAPPVGRPAPFDRTVRTVRDEMILSDRGCETRLAVDPRWGPLTEQPAQVTASPPVKWSDLFSGACPQITGREAFSAVLLYPEDETEIGELPSQSFVVDHLADLVEQEAAVEARLARADRILVHLFDGAISGCIDSRRRHDYTVVYQSGPFAQKQAQLLWNRFAGARQLPWLQGMHFYHLSQAPYGERPYDVAYVWTPFAQFDQPAQLEETIGKLAEKMTSGAIAFVTGPARLSQSLHQWNLVIDSVQPVEALPSFHMHRSILPKAQLKKGLTLYRVRRP
jgi:hypothetical protein